MVHYAPPPPEIPVIPVDGAIERPAAPSRAVHVVYPDASVEMRVAFTSVSGADAYAPIFRDYLDWPDRPNRWQLMNCVPGTLVGYRAIDLLGDPVDFRVQGFDSENLDEASDFSPPLAVTALAIDNTPCGATVVSAPTGAESCNVGVSDLQAAYVIVEGSATGVGGWSAVSGEIPIRPGRAVAVTASPTAAYYRAIAYTSDDTPGTPGNVLAA